jgi:hypothetical protein
MEEGQNLPLMPLSGYKNKKGSGCALGRAMSEVYPVFWTTV